ncbi:MAG: peptidoglycan bridge formation glycyltransferase FemA/FemB family protein, partial [Chloroflexi bacterium CFX6]|nr:peptidoglycan bridge formation glycyltransferase FemA/FemB family protein [Chloroflexi bacterium CFX6]
MGANGTASAAIDDAAWDAFVAGHPFGHCLQSAAWGRVRAAQGWQVRRVVVDAGAAGGAEIGA